MRLIAMSLGLALAGPVWGEDVQQFGSWRVLKQTDPMTDGVTYYVMTWADQRDSCTTEGMPGMAFICSTDLPGQTFTFGNMCDPDGIRKGTAKIKVRFGSDQAFEVGVNGKIFADEWGSYSAFTDEDRARIGHHLAKMVDVERFAVQYMTSAHGVSTLVFGTVGLKDALASTPCFRVP